MESLWIGLTITISLVILISYSIYNVTIKNRLYDKQKSESTLNKTKYNDNYIKQNTLYSKKLACSDLSTSNTMQSKSEKMFSWWFYTIYYLTETIFVLITFFFPELANMIFEQPLSPIFIFLFNGAILSVNIKVLLVLLVDTKKTKEILTKTFGSLTAEAGVRNYNVKKQNTSYKTSEAQNSIIEVEASWISQITTGKMVFYSLSFIILLIETSISASYIPATVTSRHPIATYVFLSLSLLGLMVSLFTTIKSNLVTITVVNANKLK